MATEEMGVSVIVTLEYYVTVPHRGTKTPADLRRIYQDASQEAFRHIGVCEGELDDETDSVVCIVEDSRGREIRIGRKMTYTRLKGGAA